jgi:DNA/RNA-binding domain of Phe-tRNA-synthetase-like protein
MQRLLLLTKDDISIFGGPAADSRRTRVTTKISQVLLLSHHPPTDTNEVLQNILDKAIWNIQSTIPGKLLQSGIYIL